MNKFVHYIEVFTIKFKIVILIVISLLTLFCGSLLVKININNNLDIWFHKSDEGYDTYKDFINHFGEDRSLIVAYKSDSLFSEIELKINTELCQQFSKIKGVKKVLGLSNVKIPEFSPFYVSLKRLIPLHLDDYSSLKKEIASHRIFVDNLISFSADATVIHIIPEGASEFKYIYSEVQKVIDNRQDSDRYVLNGGMAMTVEAEKISSREPPVFLFIATIIIILLLYLIFRNLFVAILPVLISLISIIWTLAILQFADVSINMITGVIPLILLATSIPFPVHFTMRYIKIKADITDNAIAVRKVFKDIFLPASLSAFTTSFAFLAFATSDIEPIQYFGIFSAIGIMISWLLSVLILPILFERIKKFKQKAKRFKFDTSLSNFITKQNKKIIFAGVVILLLSFLGISKLNLESDNMKYFRKSSKIRNANDSTSKWFGGVYPFELVFNIEGISRDSLPYLFKYFQKLEDELLALNEIKVCHSANGFFDVVGNFNSFKVSESELIRKFIGGKMNPKYTFGLNEYINKDFTRYRISAKSEWVNNQKALLILNKINEIVKANKKLTDIPFNITGSASVYLNLNMKLLKAQKKSLVFSFLVIFIVMVLIFKKPIFFIIGIIPNIFPVINTLGIMGFLNIPLDVGTILVASISLGIAVDDTIYFINAYSKNRKYLDCKTAIGQSFNQVRKSLTITTVCLICGFLIMTLSTYLPIVYLGVFVSLNMLFALIYDLVVLPALLFFFKREN